MKKEQSKFKTNRRQERSKYIEQGHNKNRASIEHNLYQYRTGIEHERNKYKKRTQQEQRRYENKSKAGRPTVRHENGDEFGNRNIGRSPMFEAAGRNDLFEFRIQLFEFSNRNSGKNRKIFMPVGNSMAIFERNWMGGLFVQDGIFGNNHLEWNVVH